MAGAEGEAPVSAVLEQPPGVPENGFRVGEAAGPGVADGQAVQGIGLSVEASGYPGRLKRSQARNGLLVPQSAA